MTANRRSGRLDIRGVGRNAERARHLASCGRRVARVKVGTRIAGTFHPRWFRGPIKAQLVRLFMPLRIGRANVLRIGNKAIRTGTLLVG
jgi:hypothetical protein